MRPFKMREKNAQCVKSAGRGAGKGGRWVAQSTPFGVIRRPGLEGAGRLCRWHGLGCYLPDREVVWNWKSQKRRGDVRRWVEKWGWGPNLNRVEQTALPPDSLSFFMKANAGGQGIVRGENEDSSSQFTHATPLFFDGHGRGRACIIMSLRSGTDRTKGESWPQKTTI